MSTAVTPFPRRPPQPEGLNQEFYEHCARGELRFQRCQGCGLWRHPPRVLCAACGGGDWRWEQSRGRGRLYTWTVVHRPFHPSFAEVVPYVLAVAEMDEGPRLVSVLRDVEPSEAALDLPVQVFFDDGFPYFRREVAT